MAFECFLLSFFIVCTGTVTARSRAQELCRVKYLLHLLRLTIVAKSVKEALAAAVTEI